MPIFWVDRNGRKLPISEITDRHLINAYRYFSKIPDPPSFRGEMAAFYADRDWDRLCDSYSNRLHILKEEAKRRGIKL